MKTSQMFPNSKIDQNNDGAKVELDVVKKVKFSGNSQMQKILC